MTSKSFTSEQAAALGVVIGESFGRFPASELARGMEVELEHGLRDPTTNVTNDDPLLTAKIALAHLREQPDYYEMLEMVESGEVRKIKDRIRSLTFTISLLIATVIILALMYSGYMKKMSKGARAALVVGVYSFIIIVRCFLAK